MTEKKQLQKTKGESDIELIKTKLSEALGTYSGELQNYLLEQMTKVFCYCSTDIDINKYNILHNTALTILYELKPHDSIEALQIIQMIGVHHTAIEVLRCANNPDQTSAERVAFISQYTKLIKTFSLQMQTLKSYRQENQQSLTVEQINVNQGGQAIVGTVSRGKEE